MLRPQDALLCRQNRPLLFLRLGKAPFPLQDDSQDVRLLLSVLGCSGPSNRSCCQHDAVLLLRFGELPVVGQDAARLLRLRRVSG